MWLTFASHSFFHFSVHRTTLINDRVTDSRKAHSQKNPCTHLKLKKLGWVQGLKMASNLGRWMASNMKFSSMQTRPKNTLGSDPTTRRQRIWEFWFIFLSLFDLMKEQNFPNDRPKAQRPAHEWVKPTTSSPESKTWLSGAAIDNQMVSTGNMNVNENEIKEEFEKQEEKWQME